MLIFELSSKGRKGYRLPKLDVDRIDVNDYLGMRLPYITLLDILL